jgi:hypothetical protein
MPRRALCTTALAALVLAASCKDSTVGAPAPASLRLADAEPVVEVGARKRLEVTVLDDRGRPITNVPVRFASSRPELVEVDSLTGVVTAVAPGTAEITVHAHPLRVRVPISVQVRGGTAVDSFALEPEGGDAVLLDVWSLPAKSLRFHASNAEGKSLCGLVPLTLESDTTVFVARYAPRGGDPCLITLFPRRNGVRWLRARAGDAVDSVRVTVRGMGFRYVLSTPPPILHGAGDTVRYEVLVMGEDGRRVAGVPVRFTHRGTGQSADVTVNTGADGFARVTWRLPIHPRVTTTEEETTISMWRTDENPFGAAVSAILPDGETVFYSADVAVVGGSADHIVVAAARFGESLSHWEGADYTFEWYVSYRSLSGDSVLLRRFRSPNFSFTDGLVAYVADRYGNPTGQLLTVAALEGAVPSLHPNEYRETRNSMSLWYTYEQAWYKYNTTSLAPGGVVWGTKLSAPFPRARLTFSAAGVPSRTVTVVGVDSIP